MLGKAQVARAFGYSGACRFVQVRPERNWNTKDRLARQWHTPFAACSRRK